MITGKGTTNLSIELSANLMDGNSLMSDDAIGVYRSLSELVRRNRSLEEYVHNRKKNVIFF